MNQQIRHRAWTGRVEDDALLRGAGRFGDDVHPEGMLAAYFLRSPHAYARINNVDAAAAKKSPGVVTIVTAADLESAHYYSVSHPHPIPDRYGKMAAGPHRPALAGTHAMYLGEPVALVVAQTLAQAQDAAERIVIDYEPLDPVLDGAAALRAGARQLWTGAPGNVVFDWLAPPDPESKQKAALDKIFSEAAHVVRVELLNQRLIVASLEPRVATVGWDAVRNVLTMRCGTQGVAGVRGQTAEALNIKPDELHVMTGDVGGGFGMKASGYPEYVALLHAARAIKRPIHWVSTRSEAFVSDNQGRDSVWTAELALNSRGKFLALRVDGVANVGAYVTGVAHFCATLHVAGCLPTVYDIPKASVHSRCVLTNTVPIGPYRGAGRPEASYLLERVIDAAADKTGIDPAELRRRNLIAAEKVPYKTAFGNIYDSGEFPAIFEKALALADYAGFRERKKLSKKAGKLRGIGIGCYLEIAGAFPEESAGISFPGGARLELSIGAGASGQGHVTVFGRVAADLLGITENAIVVTSGDSIRDVPGFGAVASRSAMMVGGAIANTVAAVIGKGRKIAALLLQAGEAEIEYAKGNFTVRNSSRSISLFDAAERAGELIRQGVIAEGMNTRATVKTGPSFPNGCHVAEVEIDPETGALRVVSYVGVGDCGNVLDPTIVEAQIHGGVAQGLGQALTESTVFDPAGQLLSGSFMDYAVPRAETVPPMKIEHHAVACRTNPLGVKGTGEAGTTAAPPAIINAVLDALPAGVQLDMPATPARIWQALQNARPGA